MGFSIGKSIFTTPNSLAIHAEPISFFYGITKWDRPLFAQLGIDSELRLSFWNIQQYYDFNLRLGYFFLKNEKAEIAISSGIGRVTSTSILGNGMMSLSSSVRVFYKLSKGYGAGINYYLNLNEITPMSAVRLSLNYSFNIPKSNRYSGN